MISSSGFIGSSILPSGVDALKSLWRQGCKLSGSQGKKPVIMHNNIDVGVPLAEWIK